MNFFMLSLVCIVWLQISFSVPQWSGHASGDIHVNDWEPLKDLDFSDLTSLVVDSETETLQERREDLKTEHPSVFYTVMSAFRGVYVLWMIHFFFSWCLLDTHRRPTADASDDTGSDASQPPADEDSVAVDTSPVPDDVPETVEEVVKALVDVVILAETLVSDVANSVDKPGGDGVSPKNPPVDSSIDKTECQKTVHVNCDPEEMNSTEVEPEVEIIAGSSTSTEDSSSDDGPVDSPETELLASVPDASENSSMETTEKEVLAPCDTAVPGTSGEVHTVSEEEPILQTPAKKPNLFRRAKKALKKWRRSKKKTPEKEPVTDVPPPPEPKTLEEINRMWMEEKTPYLRPIPKVHFRQRVEVKTFLVNRPMARYEEERGAGPSEVTQVEPLKKEGDFQEVGVFNTKSLKHRFLSALRRD